MLVLLYRGNCQGLSVESTLRLTTPCKLSPSAPRKVELGGLCGAVERDSLSSTTAGS